MRGAGFSRCKCLHFGGSYLDGAPALGMNEPVTGHYRCLGLSNVRKMTNTSISWTGFGIISSHFVQNLEPAQLAVDLKTKSRETSKEGRSDFGALSQQQPWDPHHWSEQSPYGRQGAFMDLWWSPICWAVNHPIINQPAFIHYPHISAYIIIYPQMIHD